jgi:hypothetical protein
MQRDPTRWLDSPDLDGDFKTALREAVDPGPSAGQLHQLAQRLGVSLPAPTPPAGGGPAIRPGASELAGRLALLSAPVIVGIAWWLLAGTAPQAPPRAAETVLIEAQKLEAPAATAASSQAEPNPAPAAAAPEPAARAPAPRRRAVAPADPVEPTASDPLAELALLRRARAALRSDPAGALQLTERHRREHGRGLLAEERELLATEALMNLGRTDEARARARAFERDYPSSAHTRRLHVIVSGVNP